VLGLGEAEEGVGEEEEIVVKVGSKEIKIDEEVLELLHEYVRTAMPLDTLARRLGLKNWVEAFEFVKAVPAWILWTPPAFWRGRKSP